MSEEGNAGDATLTELELCRVPAKQRQRLDRARKNLSAADGDARRHLELSYHAVLRILAHLNRSFRSTGHRFHAPAIFGDERANGFELVWFPGLTIIVGPSYVRCFGGKQLEPHLSWDVTHSPLAGAQLERIVAWLRQQPELPLVDHSSVTDEETEIQDS